MKPHQIAKLSPEVMSIAENLNAACADRPLRDVAAAIAKVSEWNDRTGGTQGVSLNFDAVRVLHAHLSHHFRDSSA